MRPRIASKRDSDDIIFLQIPDVAPQQAAGCRLPCARLRERTVLLRAPRKSRIPSPANDDDAEADRESPKRTSVAAIAPAENSQRREILRSPARAAQITT